MQTLEIFTCAKRQMTLSKAGCTKLFLSANQPKAPQPYEGRFACKGCALGSLHATGHAPPPVEAVRDSLRLICARCFRLSDRLIWKTLCASCDARTKEALKRKNAKGNEPALTKLLHTEHLTFSVGPTIRVVHRPIVASLPEAVLGLAKSAHGPAAFARRRVHWPALTRLGPGKPWTSQLEMCL